MCCCLQEGTDLPGFWKRGTMTVQAAERITGKREHFPFPLKPFGVQVSRPYLMLLLMTWLIAPFFFLPQGTSGAGREQKKGGGTHCCRPLWEPQHVTPSAVSPPAAPGTFQAGTWMGYGQARHNQSSASSSSSLASQRYPRAAAGAWICPSLADGCWAEGVTRTFAHEGETGALSLPTLVPLFRPLDSWRSRIPPHSPVSYGPCSTGNRGEGGMCALLSALHTNYRMVI